MIRQFVIGHFNAKTSMLKTISASLAILTCQLSFAACNCGSSNESAPCTGKSIQVEVTGQKSEENYRKITFNWAFNSGGEDAYCGQFANGDYWVAPRTGQNNVSLSSFSVNGSGAAYVDENPTLSGIGFLTRDYNNLVPAENLLTSLPKSFGYNTSLVGAAQRNESKNVCGTKSIVGSCVDAYNVLTVLDSVPKNAGTTVLRPNISRAEKDLLSWDDIALTRLPSKPFFDGANATRLEEIRTTWSHHIETLALRLIDGSSFSEGGRAFRSDLVTDDYAAAVAQHWHTDLMNLFSSENSQAQKQAALAAMLTYGKDIYHAVYNDKGQQELVYGSGAGQWLGRYPAAVFFGGMANDSKYGSALKKSSEQLGEGNNEIQELSQLNPGPNGPVWGDKRDIYNQYDLGRYWGEMLAFKAYNGASGNGVIYGKKTFRDPYALIDGPGSYPGTLYASVASGPIKGYAAAMLLIPQMCEITDNDNVVDYAIRITDVGLQTGNDECAPPDPRETSCDTYKAKGCQHYGLSNTGTATWGPDPTDLTKCIKNGKDPITGKQQTGRFSAIHGKDYDIGYPIHQVESNWEAILAGRNSCRPLKRPLAPKGLQITPKS